jgi:hypothetical protein
MMAMMVMMVSRLSGYVSGVGPIVETKRVGYVSACTSIRVVRRATDGDLGVTWKRRPRDGSFEFFC